MKDRQGPCREIGALRGAINIAIATFCACDGIQLVTQSPELSWLFVKNNCNMEAPKIDFRA
jgi:hypothetical protein